MIFDRLYPHLPPGYLLKSGFELLISGTFFFVGVETYTLNEKFYEKVFMPIVHFFDAERSHRFSVNLARYGFLISSKMTRAEYPILNCKVFGQTLNNPLGIAAGFDKNGEAILNLSKSGVGFIEIGSVTPLPQPGNEKPRVFRLLEDKAVINRYGFNSDGVGVVNKRIRKVYIHCVTPLGVNLGINKFTVNAENDYEIGAAYFAPYCDYLVINVSSPNTPGLRTFQSKTKLIKILQTVQSSITRVTKFNDVESKRPKVLLKIAPDLIDEEKKDIAKICLDRKNGVDGLIISNTTILRDNLKSPKSLCTQVGGLSGKPLRELSTKCIGEMYKLTSGQVPIIGSGGVDSGIDAYEKIRAGASLIQFYTALVYQGFPVIGKIKRELAECLKNDGFVNVIEAVGANHKFSTKK